MTLDDYIKYLTRLRNNNPNSGGWKVIYAKDDEGNNFKPVYYQPGVGIFDDRENEFISNWEEIKDREEEINAVCIN